MNASQREFFVGLAEVSGTLIGAFLVGLFFYLDLGVRREKVASNRYFRTGSRAVFALYAVPLLVPIAFLATEAVWGTVLFASLSVALISTTVSTGRLILTRGGRQQSRPLIVNEWAGIAAVIALVALPWILGGVTPQPADFTASFVLALGAGFASTVTVITNEFDAKRDVRPEDHTRPVTDAYHEPVRGL